MVKKQTLIDYWQENIQNNLKVISALIFLVISKSMGILFIGLRLGLDWLLILIILEVSLEPFIIIWLRIILTGEISASQVEKEIVSEQLAQREAGYQKEKAYEREIAEYRVQLAAKTGQATKVIIANKDFNDANEALDELKE